MRSPPRAAWPGPTSATCWTRPPAMKWRTPVEKDLGKCDILVNGAGGNNPRATTDKEYFEEGDIDADTKSFFDLDASGVEFVFNLNFLGTLIPTQAFARQMVGREGCNIINISQHERLHPAHQDPGVLRREGRHFQLHPVAGRSLLQGGHPLSTPSPRASSPPSRTPLCCGTRTARPRRAPARSLPPPRWAASVKARSWTARCCSF